MTKKWLKKYRNRKLII